MYDKGIYMRETLEERQERIYGKLLKICEDNNYILITKKEEIQNNLTEIRYICPEHGETSTKVTSLFQGKRCRKCGRKRALLNKNKTTLKDRQEKLYNNALRACEEKGYTLLSKKEDIVKNTTYIQYNCEKHGLQSARTSNLINGKGCPDCADEYKSKKFRLSTQEVVNRIENLDGKVLNPEDYKNSTTKNLSIECPGCGKPFITSLRNFTQHGGQLCPECSKVESLGESKIRAFLEKNNIDFIPQEWFFDCRDEKPLPFDFYLPNNNICIEFDGRQHFEEIGEFRNPLSYVQKHDNIKDEYCKNNNIKLVRIPYWEMENIEEILTKELNIF